MQIAFQILTSPDLDIPALGVVYNSLFGNKLTAAQDKSHTKLSNYDKVACTLSSFELGESTIEQLPSVWKHLTCTLLVAGNHSDLLTLISYLSPVSLSVAPTNYGLPGLVIVTSTFDKVRDGVQEGLHEQNLVVSQFFSELKERLILDGCSKLWSDMSTKTTSSIRLIEKAK